MCPSPYFFSVGILDLSKYCVHSPISMTTEREDYIRVEQPRRNYRSGENKPRERMPDNFSRDNVSGMNRDSKKRSHSVSDRDRIRVKSWGRRSNVDNWPTPRRNVKGGQRNSQRRENPPKRRESQDNVGCNSDRNRRENGVKFSCDSFGMTRNRVKERAWTRHRNYRFGPRPDDQPWRRNKGSATLAVTKEGGRYRLNYVLRNDGVPTETERKKIDPFGGAKPVDTASWKSCRVRETETEKEEKGWRVPC